MAPDSDRVRAATEKPADAPSAQPALGEPDRTILLASLRLAYCRLRLAQIEVEDMARMVKFGQITTAGAIATLADLGLADLCLPGGYEERYRSTVTPYDSPQLEVAPYDG